MTTTPKRTGTNRLSKAEVMAVVAELQVCQMKTRDGGYRWVARQTGQPYSIVRDIGRGKRNIRWTGGRVAMPCDVTQATKKSGADRKAPIERKHEWFDCNRLALILHTRPWTPEGLRELQPNRGAQS